MEPTDKKTKCQPPKRKYYPSMTGKERVEALQAIRGMCKDRDPDPVAWHEASRKAWDHPHPEFKS